MMEVRSDVQRVSKTFEDVDVWKRAHQFVLAAYRLSDNFPKQEMFGLTSQLRRAAVSVPANIAEGFKKLGKADKVRFYNIAQGSLEECRYYLILVNDLNYGDVKELQSEAIVLSRMLNAYMQAVSRSR